VERFPKDVNCILFANHISAWDPLIVAHLSKHNEVHFFAKASLFKYKMLAAVLRKVHAFPVKRGETDMKAMRHAMQVLKDGRVLGIFPEGTRNYDGQIKPIETGIAVMALKSRVPVIPIMINGRYKLFSKITVNIGEPIPLDDLFAKTADVDALDEVKARFMRALQALVLDETTV
jgi:1-acyl-sn-glycerol-3-phosphate acyltransferase